MEMAGPLREITFDFIDTHEGIEDKHEILERFKFAWKVFQMSVNVFLHTTRIIS